jgi:hypothetical protein
LAAQQATFPSAMFRFFCMYAFADGKDIRGMKWVSYSKVATILSLDVTLIESQGLNRRAILCGCYIL